MAWSGAMCVFLTLSCSSLKVWIFWEGHKIWKNICRTFEKSVLFCLRDSILVKKSTKIFFKCGQVVLYKLYIPWLTPSESMKISCVLVTPCFPRCAQVSGGFDTWISFICCLRKLISSVLSASFCLSSWISKACCFSFLIIRV